MTLAAARKPKPLRGHAKPRVAPPVPARSDLAGFKSTAEELGIDLMPWQETAARYLEGLGKDRFLFREVAVIVARQNGKSTLLIPLIVKRLLDGRRIMHTAQDRSLPREVFYRVAEWMWEHHAKLFPNRNGRPTKPRYANGQEEIRLTNGGIYSIVAPTRGGARGPSRDLVIIDELREMDTWDFIAAAKPTTTTSTNSQILYLSNAGEESSVVLNALRSRADTDPTLAYLEWSAAPERSPDDREGWVEANPSIGYERDGMGSIISTLEDDYRTAVLEGTLSIFETEHLCRWVASMRSALVSPSAWQGCEAKTGMPNRPFMAVSLDPNGKRAYAALAWSRNDGTIALQGLLDATGDPINVDKLGRDLSDHARTLNVPLVAYDPMTDAQLAKFFRKAEPISGQKYANASARFVTLVESKQLAWSEAGSVGADLTWTARKVHDETGSFQAVRADDARPIPASLAAIRAVWLASAPRPSSVYDDRGLLEV